MDTPHSRSSTPTVTSPAATEQLTSNTWDDSVPWVVQKYGGTSVGKSLDKIGQIVESYLPENRVAVVCSARSSSTKALGTTNLLLQASKEALQPTQQASESRNGSMVPSGSATPLYPKRVGSGFFSSNGVEKLSSSNDRDRGMSSSASSLKDLKIGGGQFTRSESPSPFQSSSYYTSTGSTSSSPSSSGILPQPQASTSSVPSFHETVDILKRDHLKAARSAVTRDLDLLAELEDEIEKDCEALRSFLSAAQIIDEISPRSQDSIVGIGEKLACKIVAASLRDRGIDSELVCLDNIVDSALAYSESAAVSASSTGDQGVSLLDQSFYDRLAERLRTRILDCGARVPIITGYFGPVPGSLLAQIGRGYTDLCAALCAVGLGAAELQVWKEVDGIFTADPRKVPTARLVPVITPDEAAELTYYGSEVIHPFTMEQVIRAKIPIRIKNVENPKGSGTIIYPQPDRNETGAAGTPVVAGAKFESRLPTAITVKDQIVVINIHSNRKTISHGFLARIFGTLDRAGVVVDLISTSEVHLSMAMQDFDSKKKLDRLVKELEKIGHITVSQNMAILSLVGRNMRHMVGIAGKMFSTLAEGNINIEMISQGSSEINVSTVIKEEDAIKALNLIHRACLTAPEVASLPQ